MNSITQDGSKLGFIGIGAMGSPITGRLLKQGFQVTVFDRDFPKANALIESGAIVAPQSRSWRPAQMLFSPFSRMTRRFAACTRDRKECWSTFAVVH